MNKITKFFLITLLTVFGVAILLIQKTEAVSFYMSADQGNYLSVSFDLNKTVFYPGETMNITASAVFNTCTNTSADIGIVGFLVSYGNPFTVLSKSAVVGGSSVYDSGSTTVQTTPGSYTLRVSTTTNVAQYLAAKNSSGGEVFKAYTFMDLLAKGESAGYTYESSGGANGQFRSSSNQILAIVNAGGNQLEYKTFEIPYTVVARPAPTVIVYVNDKSSESFVGGGSARINWTSENATHCNCNFSSADSSGNTTCGSGVGTYKGGSTYNVSKTTTFSVTCDNN